MNKLLIAVAMILFLWPLIYPRPFDLAMALVFAAPCIAVYLVWSHRRSQRTSTKRSSPYPGVVLLVILPIASGLSVARQYDLYDFPIAAVLILAAATAVFAALAGSAIRPGLAGYRPKVLGLVLLVLLSAAYAYGLLVFTNCQYDRSAAKELRVRVTDKTVQTYKWTKYYLHLSPWGKYPAGNKVLVGKELFNSVIRQDTVCIFLKKGRWGISWYQLDNAYN